MVIEGIPIMLLEFAIGQKFRTSAVNIWKKIHPSLYGVGLASIAISLLLCVYYIIVITWCIFYFFISFQKDLPWKREELCDSEKYQKYLDLKRVEDFWRKNNSFYLQSSIKNNTLYKDVALYSKMMYDQSKDNVTKITECCFLDPPQWYFYKEVLDVSVDINDYSKGVNLKLFGYLAFAWFIVYLCVVKGIKSSGKVSIV